jgi:membrane-associated protein
MTSPVPAATVGTVSHAFGLALALFGKNAMAAAFIGAFLESIIGLGVLFPGGTVVVLSGFAARTSGGLGYAQVAFAAWLGMTAGAAIDYWIGRLAGKRLIPRRAPWRLASRWRAMLRSSNAFMKRWGWWAIIAANLAGPGRSAIAVAAGASGWSFRSFLTAQAIASIGWALLYTGLGYFAAGEAQRVKHLMGGLGVGMAIMLVIAVTAPTIFAHITRLMTRWLRPHRVTAAVPAVGGPTTSGDSQTQ